MTFCLFSHKTELERFFKFLQKIEIDNEVGGNCEKIISGNFIFAFMYRM